MIQKIYTKNGTEKNQLIKGFSEKNYDLTIFFDEPPTDFLIAEISIERIKHCVFKVKVPYTYEFLEKWLYYGNWQAIYPSKADFQGIDTFRSNEEQVKNHMTSNGIKIYIDSFHDDTEWNIFTNL